MSSSASTAPAKVLGPSGHASEGAQGGFPAAAGTFASLSNAHFRLLWISMLFSFMGLHMGFLAQSALTYHLERNATSLGVVMLAWGLPQAVFSLFGGVAADRINKRAIILVSQASIGLVALTMALLIQADAIRLWHIALAGFAQGTVFSFNVPARQAWISEIMGPERLANAIALNSAAFNATSVVGPSVAGALIGVSVIGFAGVYFIMAGFFVAVVLLLLVTPSDGAGPRSEQGRVFEDLREGVRYVWEYNMLRTQLLLGFVLIVLGMPYRTLLPVFAGEIYDVGTAGLGAMFTAAGVGAVLGSLAVASMSQSRRRAQVQLGAGLGFAVVLAVFASMSWYPVGLLLLGVIGLLSMGYVALNNTLVLGISEPAYYGRVQSVHMLSWSVQPFITLPVARLADVWGAQPTVALTALVVGAALIAISSLMPSYRRLVERELARSV